MQKYENANELERDAEDGWVETINPEGNNKAEGELDLDSDDGMQVIGNKNEMPKEIDLDDVDSDADENMFNEESKQAADQKASMNNIIKRVRKYDLSITYDFYTQTPRLWLTGYSEDGVPLTQEEMFEDIAADYAKKTVTMENHPHTGLKQASIHPCNHAKVMKTIIDTIISNGGQPHVS